MSGAANRLRLAHSGGLLHKSVKGLTHKLVGGGSYARLRVLRLVSCFRHAKINEVPTRIPRMPLFLIVSGSLQFPHNISLHFDSHFHFIEIDELAANINLFFADGLSCSLKLSVKFFNNEGLNDVELHSMSALLIKHVPAPAGFGQSTTLISICSFANFASKSARIQQILQFNQTV